MSEQQVVTKEQVQQAENLVTFEFCSDHRPENWTEHEGYVQNSDGSVSCTKCNWGGKLPGYMRVFENKILDLRRYKGDAN